VDVPGQAAKEARGVYEDIQAYVPYTAAQLASNGITRIQAWFAWHDGQVSQALRSQRMGMAWTASDGVKTYNTLAELDAEAANKQNQIRALRAQTQNQGGI
jgi:hypothetical protein